MISHVLYSKTRKTLGSPLPKPRVKNRIHPSPLLYLPSHCALPSTLWSTLCRYLGLLTQSYIQDELSGRCPWRDVFLCALPFFQMKWLLLLMSTFQSFNFINHDKCCFKKKKCLTMKIQSKGLEHTWFLTLKFLCAYTTSLILNLTLIRIPTWMGESYCSHLRVKLKDRNVVDEYISLSSDYKLLFYNLRAPVCDP